MVDNEMFISSEMMKIIVQAQDSMRKTLQLFSYPTELMKQISDTYNTMTQPVLDNLQWIAQHELEMRKQLATIVAATRIPEQIRLILEEKYITDLFDEGVIKYPYPYSRETYRKLAFKEIKEEDIVKDLFIKITGGKIQKILEEQDFFKLKELCDEEAKELLKAILKRLVSNQEEVFYDFIWFFPIAENIANRYVEHDADYIISALTEFSKSVKTQKEKKEIQNLVRNIRNVKKTAGKTHKIMLGGFTKTMSKAVMMFPVTDILYPFLILEEAKNIRNDFMHGSIFIVTKEHVVIALSFLITVINFHLKMRDLNPIVLELEN